MRKVNIHPGDAYGRLTLVREADPCVRTNGYTRRRWVCRCECGTITTVLEQSLRSGATQSCGCLLRERARDGSCKRKKHGMSKTRIHTIWIGMLSRCCSKQNLAYARYGGRGISVCERWRNSFLAFLADMGCPPSASHTLDRIDNDGPYSPGNCRWATAKEQANNRCSNIRVTNHGNTFTLQQWSEHTGIPYVTLYKRWHRGLRGQSVITSVGVRTLQ